MRLKEFIIFIIIFTVCYVFFFIIVDAIRKTKDKRRENKKIDAIMNRDRFLRFAQFYGITSNLTNEALQSIFENIKKMSDIILSSLSSQYQITPYEMVVVFLYFEYFHILDQKHISLEENRIRPIDSNDQVLMLRYGSYFAEKKDYATIVSQVGETAPKELKTIQDCFLYPGVRLIESQIYYLGGLD